MNAPENPTFSAFLDLLFSRSCSELTRRLQAPRGATRWTATRRSFYDCRVPTDGTANELCERVPSDPEVKHAAWSMATPLTT